MSKNIPLPDKQQLTCLSSCRNNTPDRATLACKNTNRQLQQACNSRALTGGTQPHVRYSISHIQPFGLAKLPDACYAAETTTCVVIAPASGHPGSPGTADTAMQAPRGVACRLAPPPLLPLG
jgi:hypothetical protein